MARCFVFLVVLSLPCLVSAQSPAPQTKSGSTWNSSKRLVQGVVYQQFTLRGEYLTARFGITQEPRLVIQCTGGRFDSGYVDVGSLVPPPHASYKPLQEWPDRHIDIRFDESRSAVEQWGTTDGGQRWLLDRAQFTRLLTGNTQGRFGNPKTLVHRVTVGVPGKYGDQETIRFDMPQEVNPMAASCGLDLSWRAQK